MVCSQCRCIRIHIIGVFVQWVISYDEQHEIKKDYY